MDLLKDIWGFLRIRKKFWLLPALVALLFVGVLVALSGSAVVPMTYTLF